MLVNNILKSSTSNPSFTQSIKTQNLYEEILIANISSFLNLLSSLSSKPVNEDIFNQYFYITIQRYLQRNDRGLILVSEYKDNLTKGANYRKRVDFAFIPSAQGPSINKLYVIEAKRLPTDKEQGNREQEYVCGHKKDSGGIERYKSGSHGFGLTTSALIGYVEQKDFSYWNEKINAWISEKATTTPADWSNDEKLNSLSVDRTQKFSTSRSTVNRKLDSIELFHLWIKVPSN